MPDKLITPIYINPNDLTEEEIQEWAEVLGDPPSKEEQPQQAASEDSTRA